MAILILNQFPGFYSDYYDFLSELNEDLYLFTNDEGSHKKELYKLVKSFNNFGNNTMVEIEALTLHKSVSFHTIIAFDEEDIIRAARLRERLGIEGQNVSSAIAFRDKVQMKSLVSNKGIPCPNFKKLDSVLDVFSFVETYRLPVIIKPIDGMASMGVTVIRTEDELNDFCHKQFSQGYMIEQFLDAQMYHIDGIFKDGEIYFSSSGKYTKSCLFHQDQEENMCYLIHPKDEMHVRLVEFSRSVLSTLPTPAVMSFHCEVFHTSNNEILLCEIGSRPPGARLTHCIKTSYGIDIIQETTRMMCNLKPRDNQNCFKKHSAVYLLPKKEGKLINLVEEIPFPWIEEYFPRVKVNSDLENAESSIDIIASIVFSGETQEELFSNFEILAKFFIETLIWDVKI